MVNFKAVLNQENDDPTLCTATILRNAQMASYTEEEGQQAIELLKTQKALNLSGVDCTNMSAEQMQIELEVHELSKTFQSIEVDSQGLSNSEKADANALGDIFKKYRSLD